MPGKSRDIDTRLIDWYLGIGCTDIGHDRVSHVQYKPSLSTNFVNWIFE